MIDETTIACDMTAIPPGERGRHAELARRLFAAPARRVWLDDGLRLVLEARDLDDVALWIRYERLCCPFLRFTLDIAPAGGALTLTLTGPAGTRAFLEMEMRS